MLYTPPMHLGLVLCPASHHDRSALQMGSSKDQASRRACKHQKLVILLIFFVLLVDVAAQIENVEETFLSKPVFAFFLSREAESVVMLLCSDCKKRISLF